MKHLVYSLLIIGFAAFSCTDTPEQNPEKNEVNKADSLASRSEEAQTIEFDPSKMECVTNDNR